LVELVAMRMCGHAHHDDMLYLGKDPQPSWSYPPLTDAGYANPALYAYWRERDPLVTYAARLEAEGLLARGDAERMRREAEAPVDEQARAVIALPWPDPAIVGERVVDGEPARTRVEVLDPAVRGLVAYDSPLPPLEPNAPADPKGSTFLDAVMTGVGDALRADPRGVVVGEDGGGGYGDAVLALRPLLTGLASRSLNGR